jgi:predicted secreted hydrolase
LRRLYLGDYSRRAASASVATRPYAEQHSIVETPIGRICLEIPAHRAFHFVTFPLILAIAWLQALPGYHYQFPRDHFDHPAFRTEWWYYTGNVHDARGHRYGFELVFFRQGEHRDPAANPSAWRVDDLYLAHLALTDIDGARFHSYQRLNRAGPGVAGIDAAAGRIWNGNWDVRWNTATGAQTLTAIAAGVRLSLELTPAKRLVIHGENGISVKGGEPGQASHYVSFPRLAVAGELNGASVTGTAWMDHEWFSNQLAPTQRGWDWFSVQLDDGTELMLFELRRLDGTIDPHSSGTFIARDGRARHLARADFDLQPAAWWTSPRTGARYPIRWRITVPSLSIVLDCAAAVDNQELAGEGDATPSYWEGAVVYSGTHRGVGYLEMTGYARPMRL